jgi:neutral ceramidase
VQGYANDYAGYVTTPEEYGEQRYEGGHTMFGRWELPAYIQEVTGLVRQLASGEPSEPLTRATNGRQPRAARRHNDEPYRCTSVSVEPNAAYLQGESVQAAFAVTGDGGPLLPSYLLVERRDGNNWTTAADDGDWSTTIEWTRADGRTTANATWRVPDGTSGTFRLSYVDLDKQSPTREFAVTADR